MSLVRIQRDGSRRNVVRELQESSMPRRDTPNKQGEDGRRRKSRERLQNFLIKPTALSFSHTKR